MMLNCRIDSIICNILSFLIHNVLIVSNVSCSSHLGFVRKLVIHHDCNCRYTSKMLLAAIDERHRGTYDFIYLPIDFKASFSMFSAAVIFSFVLSMTIFLLVHPMVGCRTNVTWDMRSLT